MSLNEVLVGTATAAALAEQVEGLSVRGVLDGLRSRWTRARRSERVAHVVVAVCGLVAKTGRRLRRARPRGSGRTQAILVSSGIYRRVMSAGARAAAISWTGTISVTTPASAASGRRRITDRRGCAGTSASVTRTTEVPHSARSVAN